MGERLDEQVGSHARLPGRPHTLAHAAQELGKDDAGVPPGSHEGPVSDGVADPGQVAAGLDALELADHGLEGEGHVGAGVAVRHRVDVQSVDVALVQPEGVPVAPHHRAQVVGAQGRRGGHGRGC